jgi:hypothetical protein
MFKKLSRQISLIIGVVVAAGILESPYLHAEESARRDYSDSPTPG